MNGLVAGRNIGEYVASRLLAKTDRPVTAGLVGSDLIIVGDDRSNTITFETRKRNWWFAVTVDRWGVSPLIDCKHSGGWSRRQTM